VREKNAGDELWGEWECEENGDGILLADTKLENYANRGVADFVFIPGTGDQHIFVLRTEEEEDGHGGDILNSYGSVIDLMGNVLMEEKSLLVRAHARAAAGGSISILLLCCASYSISNFRLSSRCVCLPVSVCVDTWLPEEAANRGRGVACVCGVQDQRKYEGLELAGARFY
jgi:hypothetical protein